MALPPWAPALITAAAGIAGNYLAGRSQTNALKQAGTINQQATQDAMAQILGLYDQGRQDLSPYRAVGQPALNRLQTLAGHPQSSIGMQAQPSVNALQRSPIGGTAGGGSSIQNAMLNTKGQTAAAEAAARSNKLTGIGSTVGGVAGTLLGGPIGGIVGGALGGLEAKVLSKFGANNPYKAASSRGVEELSRLVWGTNQPGIPADQLTSGLMADVVQRRKTLAQGKEEFAAKWNEWTQAMRASGVPDDVIRSSEQTQKQYFMPVKQTFDQLAAQGYV